MTNPLPELDSLFRKELPDLVTRIKRLAPHLDWESDISSHLTIVDGYAISVRQHPKQKPEEVTYYELMVSYGTNVIRINSDEVAELYRLLKEKAKYRLLREEAKKSTP